MVLTRFARPVATTAAIAVAATSVAVAAWARSADDLPPTDPGANPAAVATFVGWDSGTAPRLLARFEGVVDRCMESKDLPYAVPEPAPGRTGGIFGVPLGLFGAPDREAMEGYLARSGYGVASQIDELRLARKDNAVMRPDPNASHLAGLRPERRQHWLVELDECRARADQALNPDPDVLDRLGIAYAEMETRLANDPRSRALEERWATCLNQRGHPFSSVEEVRGHLLPQLAEIAGRTGRQTEGGFVLGVRALDSAGQHSGDEFAGIDSDALEHLRDEEMTIARADLACRQEARAEADALRAGYETAFVAEHQADLEAIRDSWRP